MAEYVDKEKLQKDFIEHFCNGANYVFIFIDDILKFIDDEPTADVAEVKHGKWEYIGTDKKGYVYRCSNCVGRIGLDYETNYCPNCGAKMDLED